LRRALFVSPGVTPRTVVHVGSQLNTIGQEGGEVYNVRHGLGAGRIEIAHVQYYGWALKNRASLMPTREQVERAVGHVEELRARHHGLIIIDAVVPDYYARYPKPCLGGWGRRSLNVTPSGQVLPCHAAESIPGLECTCATSARPTTAGAPSIPSSGEWNAPRDSSPATTSKQGSTSSRHC